MTIKTDNDIIKALECCMNCICHHSKTDTKCPLTEMQFCEHYLMSECIDLINRQKAENKELNHKYALAVAEREANVKGFTEQLSKIRAEAITEFAERLKATPMRFHVEYVEYYDKPSIEKMVLFIDDNDIDQIAKELKGEQE